MNWLGSYRAPEFRFRLNAIFPVQKQSLICRFFGSSSKGIPLSFCITMHLVILYRAVAKRNVWVPFVAIVSIVVLSYIGLLTSIFPYGVPDSISLWDVAATMSSQKYLLPGT